jgi:hypothetical protein
MNIELDNFFLAEDARHCVGLMLGFTSRDLNENRDGRKASDLDKLRRDLRDERYRIYCGDRAVAAACVEKYAPVVRDRLKHVERTSITRLNTNRVDIEETRRALSVAKPMAVIIGGPVSSRQSRLFPLARKEYFGDKEDQQPFIINRDDLWYEHPLALDVLSNGTKLDHVISKEVHACIFQLLASALEDRRNIVIFDAMGGWEDIATMIRQIRRSVEYRVVVLSAAVNSVLGGVEALWVRERALELTGAAFEEAVERHIEARLFMPYTLNFLEKSGAGNAPDLIKIYNSRVKTPFYVNNIRSWATERSKDAERGARSLIKDEWRRQISLPVYERYAAIAKDVIKRMRDRGSSVEDVADVYMMLEPLLNCRKNPNREAAKLSAESLSSEIAACVVKR